MREIRPSGSEGGVTARAVIPTPIGARFMGSDVCMSEGLMGREPGWGPLSPALSPRRGERGAETEGDGGDTPPQNRGSWEASTSDDSRIGPMNRMESED